MNKINDSNVRTEKNKNNDNSDKCENNELNGQNGLNGLNEQNGQNGLNGLNEQNGLNEKMVACYYNKALEIAGENHISAAITELKRTLYFSLSDPTVWNLLGLCYYRAGSYKSAQYCWQQSLDIESEQHDIQRYQQELALYIGDFYPVIKEIEELTERGEYKKAARLFETKLIGDYQPSAALLLYAGIIQYLAGKRGRAVKYWAEAAEVDRTDRQAAVYMAQLALIPTFWQNMVENFKKFMGWRPA